MNVKRCAKKRELDIKSKYMVPWVDLCPTKIDVEVPIPHTYVTLFRNRVFADVIELR